MSNQVYSNNEDPYWLSARGVDKVSFNKISSPPLAYFNKGVLYELTDGHLYFNGSEIVTSSTSVNAQALATTTDPVNVGDSLAPIAGQILVATDETHAEWQDQTLYVAGTDDTVLTGEVVVYQNNDGLQIKGSRVLMESYAPNVKLNISDNSLHASPFTNSVTVGMSVANVATIINNSTIVGSVLGNGIDKFINSVIVGSNNIIGGSSQNSTLNVVVGNGFASDGNFTSGNQNCTLGINNCAKLTSGGGNVTAGYASGFSLTSGNNNVLLGPLNGSGLTTGSNNVHLSCNEAVSPSESGAIRIGGSLQTTAYLSGVYANITNNGTNETVIIDSNKKLTGVPFGRLVPMGEVYFSNYTTPYILPLTLNVFSYIAPTTFLTASGNFTSPSAAQLKYTGLTTAYASVNVTMSGLLTAGANVTMEFVILLNGVQVTGSIFRTRLPNSSDIETIAFNKFLQLATNDVVSVGCTNVTDSNDLTVGNLNLSIIVSR